MKKAVPNVELLCCRGSFFMLYEQVQKLLLNEKIT